MERHLLKLRYVRLALVLNVLFVDRSATTSARKKEKLKSEDKVLAGLRHHFSDEKSVPQKETLSVEDLLAAKARSADAERH